MCGEALAQHFATIATLEVPTTVQCRQFALIILGTDSCAQPKSGAKGGTDGVNLKR